MKTKLLASLILGTSLVVMSASPLSADLVMFDFGGGPTQSGWVTTPMSGTTTDGVTGISLTPSGFAGERDRNVAVTPQGADNNNNQVPVGVYSDMWRDVSFGTGTSVTLDLSGLTPTTPYVVTLFSYDSAQGGTTAADWGPVGDVNYPTSFIGDLVGPGPDPHTDFLTDYSTTFSLTSDGAGNATIIGTKVANLTMINGLSLAGTAIPEPSSMVLLGIGAALFFRRLRR